MANEEHVAILKSGVEAWNSWRAANPGVRPDLSETKLSTRRHPLDLRGINLSRADASEACLSGADLRDADLRKTLFKDANLTGADLSGADLRDAFLITANLNKAKLAGADMSDADLVGAFFREADLSGAKLCRANMKMARVVDSDLSGADLSDALVYGISAWNLRLEGATQKNIVITTGDQTRITVDNLEVAQFVYLLINNEKIRDVVNTVTSKAVLILGRFSLPERKGVLDAMRRKLRELNFLPIVFDFERPTDRDFTETIMTLAGMSMFVIADITNPKSSPLELQATVPNYQIPFVPIQQADERPFAMFVNLQTKYRDWVLDVRKYTTQEQLLQHFEAAIVAPALECHNRLLALKTAEMRVVDISSFTK